MPGASQAPNDCPAEPRKVNLIVAGSRPSTPQTRVTACDRIPPTERLTLRTRNSPVAGRRWSIASRAASISSQSSAPTSGEGCGCMRRSGVPSGMSAW